MTTVSMLWAQSSGAYRPAVSILGDSYSTFENYLSCDSNEVWYRKGKHDNTDVTTVEQTWWHQLITKKGWRLDKNNSFSGSTICFTGYRGEDYKNRSFVNRLRFLGCPDIILIFGATNDCWARSPIGKYKYSDWADQELYTFRPAMACLLDGLKKHYPNVRLLFILNSELSDDINESVRTICKHYDVEYLELHDIDKINGHPSIKGMKAIASQVGDALK